MFIKTPLFLALLVAPFTVHAASSATQEQEYDQVRKIALRDPKVRAAYAEADRKLEAKILQIDPALESYLRHRTPEKAEAAPATAAVKPAVAKPALAKPAPKPQAAATPHTFQRSYVVAKGDTLTSIATKYGVTVADLKSANHITDERKLAVGQVLGVPKGAH